MCFIYTSIDVQTSLMVLLLFYLMAYTALSTLNQALSSIVCILKRMTTKLIEFLFE